MYSKCFIPHLQMVHRMLRTYNNFRYLQLSNRKPKKYSFFCMLKVEYIAHWLFIYRNLIDITVLGPIVVPSIWRYYNETLTTHYLSPNRWKYCHFSVTTTGHIMPWYTYMLCVRHTLLNSRCIFWHPDALITKLYKLCLIQCVARTTTYT